MPESRRYEMLIRAGAAAWAVVGVSLVIWGAARAVGPTLSALLPVIIGAGASVLLLGPAVRRLERIGVSRKVSSLGLSLGSVGLIIIGIGGLAPWAVAQMGDFLSILPDLLEGGRQTLERFAARSSLLSGLYFPGSAALERSFLLNVVGRAGTVAYVIGGLVAGILIGGWMLSDHVSLTGMARRAVRRERQDQVAAAVVAGRSAIVNYLRGQMLLAAAVGVMTAAAAAALGVPLWLPISLTAAVGNVIPLIGPLVGGAIGALVALTLGSGLEQALLMAGAAFVIQQMEGLLLAPRVIGAKMRMRPSTVIVTITVAGALGGLLAMAAAIPFLVAAREARAAWRAATPQSSDANEDTDLEGSAADDDLGASGTFTEI